MKGSKNIKKIKVSLLGLVVLLASSCTKNFEDLNTNPNASSTVTPEYMFTKAEYDGAGDFMPLVMMGAMQYTTSYNDVAGFGSKYLLSQASQSYTVFSNAYSKELNELALVVTAVTNDTSKINYLAEARIWRAYCFSRVTDLYGDIPYSEALKGYTESNYTPVYDKQVDIYADLLNELNEAALSLDASKSTYGASDLIYGGNTAQWKQFAYSLMLRLGMRMTKVDITSAEKWVKKAIAGGVILNDADIAKMTYIASGQDINKNPLAFALWTYDYSKADGSSNPEGGKYQDVFINTLKASSDPRLGVLSVVYKNGATDTLMADQVGMPATLSTKPANFASLSEPNQNSVVNLGAPLIIMGNSEVNFLLAEAALRGWYTGADAATSYSNGISASMRSLSLFGTASAIPTDKINNYINRHPFNASATFAQQMNLIYTEFWVSLVLDPQEVFSSYRRTGYPALVPNNYSGNATGGQIFRRMEYPVSEQNLNAQNYQAAVSVQGADDFMTRIWWDKQ